MLVDLNITCSAYREGELLQINLGCKLVVHLLFHTSSSGECLVPLFITTLYTCRMYCLTANKSFFDKD